jgi:hypothetical protein
VRQVVTTLLQTVDYLEKNANMMHADIKDDNIGLNYKVGSEKEPDFEGLKLLDFGNSFKLNKSQTKGQALNFKCPEAFFGIPDKVTGGMIP